jgi:putative protein kinase ArgK-like GTPase of G3E family
MQISACCTAGGGRFWAAVTQFQKLQTANGRLAARRQQQALAWMWERIDAGLKQAFSASTRRCARCCPHAQPMWRRAAWRPPLQHEICLQRLLDKRKQL